MRVTRVPNLAEQAGLDPLSAYLSAAKPISLKPRFEWAYIEAVTSTKLAVKKEVINAFPFIIIGRILADFRG